MPSQADWHAKLAETLNDRIERRDVWLALRVEADPSYPLDSFDLDEFAEWAEDWIGFIVASTAGPVMPGTSETEWVVGENEEVRVHVLLQKGAAPDGKLVDV